MNICSLQMSAFRSLLDNLKQLSRELRNLYNQRLGTVIHEEKLSIFPLLWHAACNLHFRHVPKCANNMYSAGNLKTGSNCWEIQSLFTLCHLLTGTFDANCKFLVENMQVIFSKQYQGKYKFLIYS